MPLLDQITKSLGLTGSTEYLAIVQWIEQNGGLTAILDKFRHEGLGQLVQTWLSGESSPVSVEQITQVLTAPKLQELGNTLGKNGNEVATLVAEFLPKIVTSFTKNSEGSDHGDLASAAIDLLKNKFL